MVFPFTVDCAVCTVKGVAVVGVAAVVGAVVGVLGADPLLVVPPHAMTTITSTRPRTTSQARFENILMSALLRKQGASLVSPTPGVCDEMVLTSYVHHDVFHESWRKLTPLQVIRQEVTRASRQAPEQSDHQEAREIVLP
jgi:hypothetical protein